MEIRIESRYYGTIDPFLCFLPMKYWEKCLHMHVVIQEKTTQNGTNRL